MNYIALINSFWDFCMINPLSTGQVSLYFALLHIYNRSNWTEWFRATNQVLSILTGLSRSGILKARNELKQKGLIEFKEQGTKATLYKFIVNSKQDGVQDSTQEKTTIANSKQDSTQNSVQNSKQDGVQDSTQNSNTLYKHKQKQKQNLEKSIANAILEKSAPKLELEDLGEELKTALESYITHREAMSRPLTTAALDMLLKRLEELAPKNDADKVAVLEQSIRNGWKDIYALDKSSVNFSSTCNTPGRNRFNNFDQRETDYDALMLEKVRAKMAEDVPE